MNVFMVNVAVFRNEKTSPAMKNPGLERLQGATTRGCIGSRRYESPGERGRVEALVVSHMGVSNKMGDHRKILSSKF